MGLLALLALIMSALPWLWFGAACMGRRPAVPAVQVAEGPCVALTFDDGPRRITTTRLLDGLAERGIHATFFVIGLNVEGNEDILLRMAQEGHQIGIHAQNHKMFTGLSAEDLDREVGSLRAALGELLGEDCFMVRPPYGMTTASIRRRLGAPIILWSIDPEDWSDKDTARQVEHIVSRAEDGDIILLHDIYPSSVDTALQVADELMARGFHIVSVEELFAIQGVQPENGREYHQVTPSG